MTYRPDCRDQEDIRRSCGGYAFAFVIVFTALVALAIAAFTVGSALQFFFSHPEILHLLPASEEAGRLALPTQ